MYCDKWKRILFQYPNIIWFLFTTHQSFAFRHLILLMLVNRWVTPAFGETDQKNVYFFIKNKNEYNLIDNDSHKLCLLISKSPSQLSDKCNETVKLLQNTPVCGAVRDAVLTSLSTLDENLHYAVRSSAAGLILWYSVCFQWNVHFYNQSLEKYFF